MVESDSYKNQVSENDSANLDRSDIYSNGHRNGSFVFQYVAASWNNNLSKEKFTGEHGTTEHEAF